MFPVITELVKDSGSFRQNISLEIWSSNRLKIPLRLEEEDVKTYTLVKRNWCVAKNSNMEGGFF